jgi:peptidoglycan/LPS O-acetylase OafA/YrhL
MNTRFDAADILRGVAILAVFVYHATLRAWPWNGWSRDFHHVSAATIGMFYPLSFGWSGVALFFVLSGFCIHVSFLRAKQFTWPRFFWQRFWRIYPAYLVALVAFAVCRRLDVATKAGMKMLLSHVLLIQNLNADTFFGINASFWSLGTEMQLYLLFPLLLWLRERFGILACLGITFGVGLAWRLISLLCWGLPDQCINPACTSPLVTWFDWTLGVFVAERVVQGIPAFSRHLIWLMALIPAFVLSTLFKPLTTFSFSLAAAISAVALDRMTRTSLAENIVLKFLEAVGIVSYSAYLWHQPLLELMPHWLDPHAYLWPRLVTVGTICLLAVLSYSCLERSGIRFGKWLWNRLKGEPQPQINQARIENGLN